MSCGGGDGGFKTTVPAGEPSDILVTWDANHETNVNTVGGGYKLYYSRVQSFDINSSLTVMKDIPYVSGPLAPTSTLLTDLLPSTYYLKVVAYSAFNPPGGTNGSESLASEEFSITIP